ncbi:hypothetical protein SKAU_G00363950 [Synaphobranchus kaupii]|uniref:CLASP N-terminal domain-containing protein n=1 Tax=Synaphobranchus kaupii TaxID=118154 RepID=A0A9Q1EIW6_SYNKA|nr:hypothetical protein SKAU_G00363950 [Synaphobranchus kaupii]
MDFQGPKKDRRFKDGDMKSAIDELETGPTKTDFVQTWEELQLHHALSLRGMCPKALEAFAKITADLENEVKSSASFPGNEPAVVSAPAPRPSLLKKLRGLNKVHPLVKPTPPKKGSNGVAPPHKLPTPLSSFPKLTKTQLVLPKIQPVLPKIQPVLPKIQPVLPKIQPVLPKIQPVLPKIQQVQNPRSQVSRVAVATLGELYHHLRRAMDPELDWTAKTLLQKAGESNRSIREEVDVALRHMRHSCTPSCALKALINRGLSDRNVAVRECAARHIKALFKSMGTTGLCCRKGDIDSFLSACCRMCQDTSQEVRTCGKKLIRALVPQ